MKQILIAAGLALMTAVVAHAQALTGTWQGESPDGSQVVMEVTATSTALTLTITVDGQRLTIADGKVANKTFSFTVTLPPNDAVQAFSGEFAQDQVKLWMDRRGPASAAILTHVKGK